MTDRPIIFSGPMVRALLDGHKTMTRRLAWRECRPGERGGVREHLPSPLQRVRPGDRLWVREAPAIHMPRWASRLTLVVTAMRIERLQEITAQDCIAEGCEISGMMADPETGDPIPRDDFWRPFSDLWCSLHGKDSWDANPECIVLSFSVHKANIDAMVRP